MIYMIDGSVEKIFTFDSVLAAKEDSANTMQRTNMQLI